MVITGTLHRGDQVRHISPDVLGANHGTFLAEFLDLQNHPVAAVQWAGGSLTITALKWLDRSAHKPLTLKEIR